MSLNIYYDPKTQRLYPELVQRLFDAADTTEPRTAKQLGKMAGFKNIATASPYCSAMREVGLLNYTEDSTREFYYYRCIHPTQPFNPPQPHRHKSPHKNKTDMRAIEAPKPEAKESGNGEDIETLRKDMHAAVDLLAEGWKKPALSQYSNQELLAELTAREQPDG